jgi:hypothetical protein
MKWSRGFFRAWLVLSAIWIAYAVYSFEPVNYRLPWLWQGPRVTISSPSTSAYTFNPTKSRDELADDVTLALKIEANKLSPDDRQARYQSLSRDTNDILAAIMKSYEERRDQAWDAWIFTVAPPFAMLVLGLCIAWIFRGFRAA